MSSKRYSSEFKINAVKQYIESGKSQAQVMKELGLGDQKTFSGWIKKYKEFGESAFDKKEKVAKLKTSKLTKDEEILMLKAENDILKKILKWERGNVLKK